MISLLWSVNRQGVQLATTDSITLSKRSISAQSDLPTARNGTFRFDHPESFQVINKYHHLPGYVPSNIIHKSGEQQELPGKLPCTVSGLSYP